MITKTIKYHDYDGNEREDEFYFHLNQIEVTKLNGEVPGGLQAYSERIIKNRDIDALLKLIDLLVSRAYGEKTPDGSGFIKRLPNGLPLYEMFVNTEAYDNLLSELIKDEDTFTNFLMGCMTKEARDRMAAEIAKRRKNGVDGLTPIAEAGKVE